jgi:hemoglobin
MTSLYERLGGTAGIRAIVESVAGAHLENPRISQRFFPLTQDPAKLETALTHLSNFMEAGSGGPAKYTGRDMPAAHFGMNISDEEYMAAMDDIMNALAKHGRDEATQKDVLYLLYQLRPSIVRK